MAVELSQPQPQYAHPTSPMATISQEMTVSREVDRMEAFRPPVWQRHNLLQKPDRINDREKFTWIAISVAERGCAKLLIHFRPRAPGKGPAYPE